MKTNRFMLRSLLTLGLSGLLGACGGSEGAKTSGLFINELQPSNQDVITDEYGEPDDWIEIFNADATAVDLKDFRVADTSGISQTIPGSLVVPPGGFVLLWADDSPSQGVAHLGFKLGAKKGDTVTLMDANGRTVDSVSFGQEQGQSSYARFPDGTGAFAWCAVPTPGTSNGPACAGR
jgi:hypothetical protein